MRYILICFLFLSCTKHLDVKPVHNDATEDKLLILNAPQIKLTIWLNGILYDGFTIDFDTSYCNCVDEMDANKPLNFNENFGIEKYGEYLSWERRPYISKDSTDIKMTHMQVQTYQVKISSSGFTGNAGFYIYDVTKGKRAIKPNTDTTVDMVIETAGLVENRFKIIYK